MMTLISLMSIFACLYIHIKHKLPNFKLSLRINLFCHLLLLLQTKNIYELFENLQQVCNLVWDYYDKKGKTPTYINIQGQDYEEIPASGVTYKDSKVHSLCVQNYAIYYTWLIFNIGLTFLRLMMLLNLFRGMIYL